MKTFLEEIKWFIGEKCNKEKYIYLEKKKKEK